MSFFTSVFLVAFSSLVLHCFVWMLSGNCFLHSVICINIPITDGGSEDTEINMKVSLVMTALCFRVLCGKCIQDRSAL